MLCQARSLYITEFLGLVRRPTNQRQDDYFCIRTSFNTNKSFGVTVKQVIFLAPALCLANVFELLGSCDSGSLHWLVLPIRTYSC